MNPIILDSIGALLRIGSGFVTGGTAPVVLTLIQEAIKEEPAIEAALREVFSKTDPTDADWTAARAVVTAIPEPIVETEPPPITPPPA